MNAEMFQNHIFLSVSPSYSFLFSRLIKQGIEEETVGLKGTESVEDQRVKKTQIGEFFKKGLYLVLLVS